MSDLDTALSGALWAARRGWKVHPCNGKVPTTLWADTATDDIDQVTAWLAGTSLNYGIACGPSHLLVLDDDTGDALADYAASIGEQLPETFTVITGRGLHYYSRAPRQPLGNGRGRLPAKVDVRGIGGYVIGPGSSHANGATYAAANLDAPLAEAPAWIVALLTEAEPFTSLQRDYTAPIPIGQRHQALVAYAGHLRHLDLSAEERKALMKLRWEDCEQRPGDLMDQAEADAILDDVLARYGAAPAPEARFDIEVAAEAHRLRVIEAARDLVRAERTPPAPPMDIALVDEIADDEEIYQIDNMLPMGGNALIVAKRKTGKSTYLLNKAKALRTGEPFLGRLAVQPITGRVAYLNYEVPRAMMKRWAHDAGLTSADLLTVNLRGRRNPLRHEADLDELRRSLIAHQVEILIVDPLSRAFTGDNIDNTAQMTQFLASLDILRADVGASSILLAAHAGWNNDRARNSSVVEDWADAIITMTKDAQGRRYLSAIGRDVELDEDLLTYDHARRTLTLSGAGSRKATGTADHLGELADALVDVVIAEPGLTTSDIEDRLRQRGHGLQKGDGGKAAKIAEGSRRIIRRQEGRATRHYSPTSPTSPTYPDGEFPIPQLPVYTGRGNRGEIEPDAPRAMELIQDLLGGEVVA